MLAYFMGMGGLAIGFIIGMLYSEYKLKKKRDNYMRAVILIIALVYVIIAIREVVIC